MLWNFPLVRRQSCRWTLPAEFIIVFDPVTHAAQFIDVKGEPTRERQTALVDLQQCPGADGNDGNATRPAAPVGGEPHGHPRAAVGVDCRRRAARDAWPTQAVHDRQATAVELPFRYIYRAGTLNVDQRLKITSMTFLFTDLRSSTEFYHRVGDLVAFDMVRSHFRVLQEIVTAEAGAVVKTIGDADYGNLPDTGSLNARGPAYAEAMRAAGAPKNGREDLLLKDWPARRPLPCGDVE